MLRIINVCAVLLDNKLYSFTNTFNSYRNIIIFSYYSYSLIRFNRTIICSSFQKGIIVLHSRVIYFIFYVIYICLLNLSYFRIFVIYAYFTSAYSTLLMRNYYGAEYVSSWRWSFEFLSKIHFLSTLLFSSLSQLNKSH